MHVFWLYVRIVAFMNNITSPKQSGREAYCYRESLLNDMKIYFWAEIKGFLGNSFGTTGQNKSCVQSELLELLMKAVVFGANWDVEQMESNLTDSVFCV